MSTTRETGFAQMENGKLVNLSEIKHFEYSEKPKAIIVRMKTGEIEVLMSEEKLMSSMENVNQKNALLRRFKDDTKPVLKRVLKDAIPAQIESYNMLRLDNLIGVALSYIESPGTTID